LCVLNTFLRPALWVLTAWGPTGVGPREEAASGRTARPVGRKGDALREVLWLRALHLDRLAEKLMVVLSAQLLYWLLVLERDKSKSCKVRVRTR
jgi:hypothetical protein